MNDDEIYSLLLEEIKEMRKKLDNIEEILNAEMRKSEGKKGVIMSELIDLTPDERKVVLELIKSGKSSLGALSEKLNKDNDAVERMADSLVEKGYLKSLLESGQKTYEVFLARKKPSQLPFDIWGSLEKKLG